MAGVPFVWSPRRATVAMDQPGYPIPGGVLDAGDWAQVFITFRGTDPVLHAAEHFMIHVLYGPASDAGTPHPDQPTTYGGGVNTSFRRRIYRSDPNTAFQVPWKGQLWIIAGDDSPLVNVDVVLARGHAPRDVFMSPWLQEVKGPHRYGPPVVAPPGTMCATWIDIPTTAAIPFPDGAEQMLHHSATGAPTRFTMNVMGNPLSYDLTSGLPGWIATFASGNAGPGGVPATWRPAGLGNLTAVSIVSRVGG